MRVRPAVPLLLFDEDECRHPCHGEDHVVLDYTAAAAAGVVVLRHYCRQHHDFWIDFS